MHEKNHTINKFLGNTGWMLVQQIYSMILSLFVGSLTARYLGPSNYGLINYGASIIAFFTIISKLGLDSVIINEMINSPEKRGKYLGSALAARLAVSLLSMFFIFGITVILEPENELLISVTMLQSIAVVMQSYEVLNYWFQSELKMRFAAIAAIFSLTVAAFWKILLLINKASVRWFALSNSVNYLAAGISVAVIFKIISNVKLKFSLADLRFLLGKSYHFIISGIAVTLYSQIDKIMIGKLLNETELGFYTAASTIAYLWIFIPAALINSARPLIVEKKKHDYSEYLKDFQRLLFVITALAVIVIAIVILTGKAAVWILYGESYYPASVPLTVLICSTGFAAIGMAREIWTVAEGYNKYDKYFTLYGAAVNISLNALLIPSFGILGASAATLASQIFVCFLAPMFYKSTRRFNSIYFGSLKLIKSINRNFRP